jgi:hypothetical protein
MRRGLPENRHKGACPDEFSLLTATEGGATGQTVAGGNVAFPFFWAYGRLDRYHTLGQPLPLKIGFLSLMEAVR